MVRLRYLFIASTVWLVFLFNIERVIYPLDITKYTYMCVALVAVITMLVSGSQQFSLWVIAGIPSLLLVLLQIVTRDPVLGTQLPVTVTEIASVVITAILGRQVNRYLLDFEEAVAKITIHYTGKEIDPFEVEQGVMYTELKRARLYKRPLSLVALKLKPESLKENLPRLIALSQQSVITQIAMANVARVLDEELFDTDIIAQYKDTLLIMLPELDTAGRKKVIARVEKSVKTITGMELVLGAANFPEDAVTFEALFDAASHRMNTLEPDEQQTSAETENGSTRSAELNAKTFSS